jgi:hypothetical protein
MRNNAVIELPWPVLLLMQPSIKAILWNPVANAADSD